MKRIVIFGAGGHGREVLQLLRDINAASPDAPPWHVAGFIADAGMQSALTIHDLPMLGGLEWLTANDDVDIVVAIGAPRARRAVVQRIEQSCGARFASLSHPRSCIGQGVEMGPGTIIFAGCVLTTDIVLGRHVHLNACCNVSHDSRLGDFTTFGPGVHTGGGVSLHEGAEMGTAGAAIPRVQIGAWSMVGAGALVTRDLPPCVLAMGVPARVVKSLPAP